jgi:hypothetical protein
MLARLQHGDGLFGVKRDRRHEVYSVDPVVRQNRLEGSLPLLYLVSVPDRSQNLRIRVADRQRRHIGMMKIDGNELGPKTETYECDIHIPGHDQDSRTGKYTV